MLPYFSIFVCVSIVFEFFATVEGGPWASPALEQLDEVNDVEIYRAILTSMQQWEKGKEEKEPHARMKRDTPSVCYKDLGCFEASGPFGYLDMLPGAPEEIGTKFYLYPSRTKRRSGFPHAEVPFGNLSDAFTWAQQGFNKSLPTKILIHGFGSDCTHIWVYELRSALMAVEEMNIICVDWSKGAELPNYVKAASNTRLIGKQLALLLKGLIEQAGLSKSDLHLIGFSLGAHVAGFTGSELGNLSRITGLDPAGPLFEAQDPRARLDQTDADFVDVIHSNGENIILGGLGTWQPLGHVDFYPNGGRMQKGCSNIFVGAVSDIIWSSAVEGRSLCNHRRAYKFFTDSVSPRCHFPAFPCDSYEDFLEGRCFPCTDKRDCGNMGYYADRSKGRGQLFLITRDEEPFCAHQYSVKIESSISDIPITSYGKIQITLVGESELNETFIMTKKDDEEMKLGTTISRILVPHPVLAEPKKIQILYTAYSGWLSSGLTHWKIDKITLSDSFGKSSSICKKSLILESGKSVILPLYPGECNLPKDDSSSAADERVFDQQNDVNATDDAENLKPSKFVPTPVIKIGNEAINKDYQRDKIPFNSEGGELLKSPLQSFGNDKDNKLEEDKETSRALNLRLVKEYEKSQDASETLPEVVEPILKTHSNKNARSHDPFKNKAEISEPILGPTTSRPSDAHQKTTSKEIVYNFYDSNDNEWQPSSNVDERSPEKWKRHDGLTYEPQKQRPEPENESFNLISMTVQLLPQRIARMLEEAEKYARETILPFVSAHTPKIIRDFIAPEEQPKYLPLQYEEETTKINFVHVNESQPSKGEDLSTTPYSNIQKISKKGERILLVYPESSSTSTALPTPTTPTTKSSLHNGTIKFEFSVNKKLNFTKTIETNSTTTKREVKKEIYIDLPVFDETGRELKYIPLIKGESEKRR